MKTIPAAPVRSGPAAAGSIAVGAVLGFDAVGYSVALATVAFGGPMAFALGLGTFLFLLSIVVFALVLIWRSAIPGAIGLAQDAGIAILAPGMVLAATLAPGPPEAKLATGMAVLALTTLLTGGALMLIGVFRFGRIARVLPFPIAAGFPASSGWLLLVAGLTLVFRGEDASLSADLMFYSVTGNVTYAVLLVAGFCLYTWLLPGPLAVAVPLVVAVALFYGGLYWFEMSLDQARDLGLLPRLAANAPALPDPSLIASVRWPVVAVVAPTIAAATLVNIMGFVLNTGAIELEVGGDVDIDREARITGAANLAVATFGGAAGYISASSTLLAHRLGCGTRITALTFVVFMLASCYFATAIVAHTPVFAAAGLVIYVGLSMLERWVLGSWFRLPRQDFAIIAIILLTTAFVGIIAAIAVGTVLALLIFIVTYARMPVVRYQGAGANFRSNVDRSAEEEALLAAEGGHIHVLVLQGFLFFGSIENMLNEVRRRADDPAALTHLIVDFGHVRGIDSAACAALTKLGYIAQEKGFMVTLSALSPGLLRTIGSWGVDLSGSGSLRAAGDLDAALEAAEDGLLESLSPDRSGRQPKSLLQRLQAFHALGADLFQKMERMEVPAGHKLISAGSVDGDVFFLEQGRVSVQLTVPGGQTIRLRSMRSGAVVGEAARYLSRVRTADVVVDEPSVIYRLSDEEIDRIEQNAPDLASVLHAFVAKNLAEKLMKNNALLGDLRN